MNFGDILEEWDDVRKKEASRPGKAASQAAAPKPAPPPSAREGMIAWMNRYGVPDKDGRGDPEEGGMDRSERERERARLERMKPEASLDLHGLTTDDALARLRLFLDDSLRKGLCKVLIIHGKGNHSEGDPVLAGAVARFLEAYPPAGKRGPADRALGGRGALVLYLKNRSGGTSP